ncbi:MAG: PhoH family protein [Planctomycetaceae bacterium]|nr:PhoH family protein [Planctomycetaceae bacterium]
MSEATINFENQDLIRTLFGERDRHLRKVRDSVGVEVVIRGDELHLFGTDAQVTRGREIFAELQALIQKQGILRDGEVIRVIAAHLRPGNGGGISERQPLDPPPALGAGLPTPPPETDDAVIVRGGSRVKPNGNGPKAEPTDGGINVFDRARRIHPRTAGQFEYVEAIRQNDLSLCIGPAGSGKTYLAVAMAVNALRQDQVRKIVLVRPAVEAGERLGFLPGDMHAKLNPYLRPLLDSLNDILSYEQVKRYLEGDVIEIVPLAYMRGRTLNSTFMILDEGQNTTVTQMKMFLTRMGYDSKIVVTGDVTQIDLPPQVPSGLIDAFGRLGHLPGVSCVQLTTQDIVRHRLVGEIVKAYDGDQQPVAKRRNK